MGLSHLILVRNLINTSLWVKVSIVFSKELSSTSKEKERVITSTLPSIPIRSMLISRFESSGGRLQVYETSMILFFVFTTWIWFENIWIWVMVLISTFWILLKFKMLLFHCAYDLEKPRIVIHVPSLIRA